MKVEELIEKLSKFDGNKEVMFMDSEYDYLDVQRIEEETFGTEKIVLLSY